MIIRQAALCALFAVGLPVAVLLKTCQTTVLGASPEHAVRTERQGMDWILRQAFGVLFVVSLPVAVLLKKCQTTVVGASPECTVWTERQGEDEVVRQATLGAVFSIGLPVTVLVKPP